jgi:hypothetical protein
MAGAHGAQYRQTGCNSLPLYFTLARIYVKVKEWQSGEVTKFAQISAGAIYRKTKKPSVSGRLLV